MIDLKGNNGFFFSQNSLSNFLTCPLKFKLKYVEGINWKLENEELKSAYKSGLDFHLLAERYFSNIKSSIKLEEKMESWLENLQEKIPMEEKNEYFPEHEIRYNKENIRLMARYDLIILKEDSLEIWDWKTSKNKIKKDFYENKLQSIIYLFLLYEGMTLITDKKIEINKITMNYWQANFKENLISFSYTEEKHQKFKIYIVNLIRKIQEFDFFNNFQQEKPHKACKYCEFNYFCNDAKINFDVVEELDEFDLEKIFYDL